MSISRKQITSVIAVAMGGNRLGGFEDQPTIGLKQSEGQRTQDTTVGR